MIPNVKLVSVIYKAQRNPSECSHLANDLLYFFFLPRRVEGRLLEWSPPLAQLFSALCIYGLIYLLLLSVMGRGCGAGYSSVRH